MIHIEDTNDGIIRMRDEVSRIGEGPGFKTIGLLEATLRAAYLHSQGLVHVITGSLKGSGHTDSDYNGDVWEGSVIYGGPSPGPNNPVDYAFWEYRRHETHDLFITSLVAFDEQYETAIASHWDSV